jgi:hypothetical protein
MTFIEPAARTYLRFIAYSVPATVFWVFADVVLMPRIEVIWQQAGERAAQATWVINVSRGFVDHFIYVLAGLIVIFVLFEKTWPRWQVLRCPLLGFLGWLLTFGVMAGVTWTAVAACLVVPMVLSQ